MSALAVGTAMSALPDVTSSLTTCSRSVVLVGSAFIRPTRAWSALAVSFFDLNASYCSWYAMRLLLSRFMISFVIEMTESFHGPVESAVVFMAAYALARHRRVIVALGYVAMPLRAAAMAT